MRASNSAERDDYFRIDQARAQVQVNKLVCTPGAFDLPAFGHTFLDYLLEEVEAAYPKVCRSTSPDEHRFSDDSALPKPILAAPNYPSTQMKSKINLNEQIVLM